MQVAYAIADYGVSVNDAMSLVAGVVPDMLGTVVTRSGDGMAYIQFPTVVTVGYTKEVAPNINIDFTPSGDIAGIEMLAVSN